MRMMMTDAYMYLYNDDDDDDGVNSNDTPTQHSIITASWNKQTNVTLLFIYTQTPFYHTLQFPIRLSPNFYQPVHFVNTHEYMTLSALF